jgi:peptidoglycan hydrolase-like protein with peptidoglycan-binding domain
MPTPWFEDTWRGFEPAQLGDDPFSATADLGSHLDLKVEYQSQDGVAQDDPSAADFLLELAEPLARLGYLPIVSVFAFQNQHETAKEQLQELAKKLAQKKPGRERTQLQQEMTKLERSFRKQQEQFRFPLTAALNAFRKEATPSINNPFDIQVLQHLDDLVAFEVPLGLHFSFPLSQGSRGLAVRVLQYRLKILGYFHGSINGNFESDTTAAWLQYFIVYHPGTAPPQNIDASAFDLLGNPYELTRQQFIRLGGSSFETNVFHQFTTQPTIVAQPIVVRFVGEGEGIPRLPNTWTLDAKGLLASGTQEIDQTMIIKWQSQAEPAIRLLQMRLWMEGFYSGLQDGFFQEGTTQALTHFLTEELGLGDGKALLPYVGIRGDFLIISPMVFKALGMQRTTPEQAQHAEFVVIDTADVVAKKEAEQAQQSEDKSWFKRLWARFKSSIKKVGQAVKSLFASLYRGVKHFIVRVARAIGKGILTIGKLLKRSVQFVSLVTQRIGRGFSLFWQRVRDVIRFLSDPQFTSNVGQALCKVQFNHNFDALVFAGGDRRGHPGELSQAVTDTKQWLTHSTTSLTWTIRFVFTVLKIIISVAALSSPLVWAQVGLKIYRAVLQFLQSDPEPLGAAL